MKISILIYQQQPLRFNNRCSVITLAGKLILGNNKRLLRLGLLAAILAFPASPLGRVCARARANKLHVPADESRTNHVARKYQSRFCLVADEIPLQSSVSRILAFFRAFLFCSAFYHDAAFISPRNTR